jgi:K+-transporting ATPase ATPase A chain
MSANGDLRLIAYLAVLLALAKPLGTCMAPIYEAQPAVLNGAGAPVERFHYRVCGVHPTQEMHWTRYALAMLVFNLLGGLVVYGLKRLQACLPLNPQAFAAVSHPSKVAAPVARSTEGRYPGLLGEPGVNLLLLNLALDAQAEPTGK